MGRILFQIVLPILLPTLIYVAWLAATRRRAEKAESGERPEWSEAPWLWLAAGGVALAAFLALASAFFGGAPVGGVYVPPQVIDGKVVPGRVEPTQ